MVKKGFTAHLRGREANLLQFFFLFRRIMLDDPALDSRFSACGILWRYKGLVKQFDNMLKEIFRSIPEEKREQFRRTVNMQELYVATRGGAVDPTGDLMVVPRKAMLKILGTASKECMLCDGSNEDRRKCEYRRAIKKMVITDLSLSEKDGICMGKKFDWEGN